MYFMDYTWDLYPNYLLLDEELTQEKLEKYCNWKEGDYFQLVKRGNTLMFKKVDPIYPFVQGLKVNGE